MIFAEFDGSVIVERTAGEVLARCHVEEANLLAERRAIMQHGPVIWTACMRAGSSRPSQQRPPEKLARRRFGWKVLALVLAEFSVNGVRHGAIGELMSYCPWPVNSCPSTLGAPCRKAAPSQVPTWRLW